MRVTPKTMVNPAAMMNSDEALASPLSACTRRNETSGKRVPREHSVEAVPDLPWDRPWGRPWAIRVRSTRGPLGGRVERCELAFGFALFLALGPHLSFREQVLGAVLVLPILHAAHLAVSGRLAHPGAHGALVIERANCERTCHRSELEVLQRRKQFLRVGGAGLGNEIAQHVAHRIAQKRAEAGCIVELGAIGVDEGLVRRFAD